MVMPIELQCGESASHELIVRQLHLKQMFPGGERAAASSSDPVSVQRNGFKSVANFRLELIRKPQGFKPVKIIALRIPFVMKVMHNGLRDTMAWVFTLECPNTHLKFAFAV